MKSRKLPKCVRPEEYILLIKATPRTNKVARVAFLLAYGAGMRLSEVLRCSKEHFRGDSIFIPESKYGVERIVPVPKGWRSEFLKELPLEKQKSKRTLQRYFEKYRDKAEINPKHTFHSLRHGFAMRLESNGVPLSNIQVLMGHANVSTTSIYTRANPRDALNKYEELF